MRTVAIADIVMSLDNVLAIAAAAKGHPWLIGFGLLVSIPLIVAGATLIMAAAAYVSRFSYGREQGCSAGSPASC